MGGDQTRVNNDYLPSGVGGQSASPAFPPMGVQFIDYKDQANPEQDRYRDLIEELFKRFAKRAQNDNIYIPNRD